MRVHFSLLLLTLTLTRAGETPPAPDSASPSSMVRDLTNLPALKVVGPGIFELGKVRLDKKQRTVSFPAVLNMSEGAIEYFLVTTYGKTHESVLRTDASALHIHVAMVLLDAKGAGTNLLNRPPPEYGGSTGLSIPGDPITVEVQWREKGKQVVHGAQELISRQVHGAGEGKGRWVYNGSAVWEGTYLAQSSGSLISLIPDPAALVNRVGPGQENDHVWTANTDRLPPPGVPVQVTIRLTEALLRK